MKALRRALRIVFKDGTTKDLEVCKVTAIRADIGMLHMDKLKNDMWRLTYTNDITEEFSKVDRIEVVRED
jgi:hypothetical protein